MISEVWMRPNAELTLVIWNECNCHPDWVTMYWGKKWSDSGWYGSKNKSSWTKHLMKRGWERL